MKTKTLYLFTRTPLHVGTGSGIGAIDQPVVRERHTGFPFIPGSAIKGVWADRHLETGSDGKLKRSTLGREIFGHEKPEEEDAASGSISFGEARLLAFPVRSAKGCFAWLTSPLILERWKRDTGNSVTLPDSHPSGMQLYGDATTLAFSADNVPKVVLEDYEFDVPGTFKGTTNMTGLLGDTGAADNLWAVLCPKHLCLISDDMMSHFTRNACAISQHVKIDDETGTAAGSALFNQECVPSETLFYTVLSELRKDGLTKLALPYPPALQIGGDATTGHGFCSAHIS